MCSFPSIRTERGKIVFHSPSLQNNLHRDLRRQELISLNFKSILKDLEMETVVCFLRLGMVHGFNLANS